MAVIHKTINLLNHKILHSSWRLVIILVPCTNHFLYQAWHWASKAAWSLYNDRQHPDSLSVPRLSTHCSPVTQIWVNIGSGNGLLPYGTKPLPEPMLTYHQRCSLAFTWEQSHAQVLMNLIHNMCSEIACSKLLPHLPGTNELTHWILHKMTDILHTTISNAFYWLKIC